MWLVANNENIRIAGKYYNFYEISGLVGILFGKSALTLLLSIVFIL